ncbi:hypothetical protein VHA_000951 [Grimontia hollisae CIP 101886]|uniref:Uncharacterized protein n=1 Tax=Grimontia hollisae CIP 101886 TaxID=675812 RepID=D0I5D4_GRIHO|nr:hypothetical protein VHA_000951 [Grimontia hollisae CIP 101886]
MRPHGFPNSHKIGADSTILLELDAVFIGMDHIFKYIKQPIISITR